MTGLPEFKGFFLYSLKHPGVKPAASAALGICALNLAVLLFFWGPSAWRHHQEAEALGDDRRARLEAAQSVEFFRRYQELSQRAGALESKWVTPSSQSSLIDSLNGLAAQNGLRVLSQDFNEKASPRGGQDLEEDVSLEGTYPSFRHFLTGLESLKSLTVLQEARLEKVGEGGGSIRAVLKLATYYRPSAGKRPPG